jgi:hypothetical protein
MRRHLVALVVLVTVGFAGAASARAGTPQFDGASGLRHRTHSRRAVLQDFAGASRLIRVHGVGAETTLFAPEPVAAVAVRDVDFDGDLDVLAASTRAGLLVWRNDGQGRFALASPRRERPRPGAGLSAEPEINQSLGASDDRQHPSVLRVPACVSSLLRDHAPPPSRPAGFRGQQTTPSGRAPPAAC